MDGAACMAAGSVFTCVYVCQVGDRGEKREELILTPPHPPPSLVWQRWPELPLTFMQTTKGPRNESWHRLQTACARAHGCVSACHFFLCVCVFFSFFFLQELAETKHHLHAAGRPGCLLLSPGQGRGSLHEHCYETAPSAAAAFSFFFFLPLPRYAR